MINSNGSYMKFMEKKDMLCIIVVSNIISCFPLRRLR